MRPRHRPRLTRVNRQSEALRRSASKEKEKAPKGLDRLLSQSWQQNQNRALSVLPPLLHPGTFCMRSWSAYTSNAACAGCREHWSFEQARR